MGRALAVSGDHSFAHDADARRERVKALPAKALKRIVLAELNREYTLYEIAIITSAGPARALGLKQKGHLGVGADAM